MSADSPSSRGDTPRFTCRWSFASDYAATVEAVGRLDADAAGELGPALDRALARARLVLLALDGVSEAEPAGLDAVITRSVRARHTGSRLLVIGAPPQVDAALRLAGVELLTARSARAGSTVRRPANPVNARVLPARVMSVEARGFWLHAADGRVHRAWAPGDIGHWVRAQTWVDLFLDERDRLNGWYKAKAGLAINQRLAAIDAAPEAGLPVACQGPCGVVWQAPAAAKLIEHGERCLTCAGALALG